MKPIRCRQCGQQVRNPIPKEKCPHCYSYFFKTKEEYQIETETLLKKLKKSGKYLELRQEISSNGQLESIASLNNLVLEVSGDICDPILTIALMTEIAKEIPKHSTGNSKSLLDIYATHNGVAGSSEMQNMFMYFDKPTDDAVDKIIWCWSMIGESTVSAFCETIRHPDRTIICQGCGAPVPDNRPSCPVCNTENAEFKRSHATNNGFDKIRISYSNTSSAETGRRISTPNLTPCPACNHPISTQAESCPNCGQPTGVHVCPKCRSVNTKVISGASKAASVWMWGVFAANKVVSKYQCKDCGHKW